MLSKAGKTCFHSRVFNPQSGLQINIQSERIGKVFGNLLRSKNNLAWLYIREFVSDWHTWDVKTVKLHENLEQIDLKRHYHAWDGNGFERGDCFTAREFKSDGSAYLTQMRSFLPLRMLLSKKDWIFFAMKSTLHSQCECEHGFQGQVQNFLWQGCWQ